MYLLSADKDQVYFWSLFLFKCGVLWSDASYKQVSEI